MADGTRPGGAMRIVHQFATFSVVGVIAAVFHYGTLIGLREAFGVDPVVGSATGFVTGGIVSYLLNYHVTFGSKRSHAEAASLFIVVAAIGLAINTALMALLVNTVELQYLVAQIATTGIVLVWHFAANRLWTFAR
ncbi:MAG: GtrA family protein [Alphaproteobacteria bacterium]